MTRIIRSFSVSACVILCSIFATSTTFAQTEEYKEYIVKKGDTLWTISSHEVADPFLWPKIWKENPAIKNPDLIYPGQTVKIPLRLTRKEPAPPPQSQPVTERVITPSPFVPAPVAKPRPLAKEPKTEGTIIKAVERDYLIDKEALISSGYISDSLKSEGEIIGSPSEHSVLGKGDYAYIRTARAVNVGDKFYIVRSLGKVNHPDTGVMMGYLIDVLGITEVVGNESGEIKTKITSSYGGILTGDVIIDFKDVEQPFLVDKPRTPDIRGFVVATRKLRIVNGMLDVVYIDKGTADGLEVGDALGIVSNNLYSIPNGSIQIISARGKTATAVVRTSQKEVSAGDSFGRAQEKLDIGHSGLPEEGFESAVNLFTSQYVRAYESGDINRFMSFYSASAVENDSLHYEEIRRAYEKGFAENRYSYILKDIRARKDNNTITLTGTYSIKSIEGKSLGSETRGNITWMLVREDGALRIAKVNYDRI